MDFRTPSPASSQSAVLASETHGPGTLVQYAHFFEMQQRRARIAQELASQVESERSVDDSRFDEGVVRPALCPFCHGRRSDSAVMAKDPTRGSTFDGSDSQPRRPEPRS